MLNQSPSLICIAHVVKGVKKRRGFRVMKRLEQARLLADWKNTAQEPRQLEDQNDTEDDADLMGLMREEVEDKAWTIIQQSGDSRDTYKQMDDDEPHHRFMGDEELPLPHHRGKQSFALHNQCVSCNKSQHNYTLISCISRFSQLLFHTLIVHFIGVVFLSPGIKDCFPIVIVFFGTRIKAD